MSKKPKYPDEKLTNDDRKILNRAAIKLLAKLYSLLEKYSDAKYIAKFLKKLQSPKNSAYLYALMYTSISPVDETFQPHMLNRRLLSDIRHSIEPAQIDTLEKEHPGQLLQPRELREHVLKTLQGEGVIQHLEQEGVIRGQHRERRPRGKPKRYIANRGGRLSEYKVSEGIDAMKKIMEKRGALEYFVRALNKTGLVEKLIEKAILLLVRAARTSDEVVFQRGTGIIQVLMHDTITETDSKDFRTWFQDLKALREDQLQQEAHVTAQSALKSMDYYALLLFLTTLFEI